MDVQTAYEDVSNISTFNVVAVVEQRNVSKDKDKERIPSAIPVGFK